MWRSLGLIPFLALFALGIAAVIGWIMNIVKIIGMFDDPTLTPMFFARGAGIFFAPIGAVLGYF